MRPHCSFCGTFTGPFSQIEGLFTILICIPCLEARLAQPGTLLGLHDPGQPWEKWGCPIEGCGRWFLGPWCLEGHTAAEHPGWTATYELLRPYPNQRQRVVYRLTVDRHGHDAEPSGRRACTNGQAACTPCAAREARRCDSGRDGSEPLEVPRPSRCQRNPQDRPTSPRWLTHCRTCFTGWPL